MYITLNNLDRKTKKMRLAFTTKKTASFETAYLFTINVYFITTSY